MTWTVMTRNLFLGADLTPVRDALSSPEGLARLPEVVAAIFNPSDPLGVVQRTEFPTRVAGLADEIEAARPDLIGLQEAAVWRTREHGAAAATVACDFLELLEAELARRGLRYRRVAAVDNGDVELPSAAGFNVGLTDREAILARDDEGGAALELSDVRTANFAAGLPVATAHGTFSFTRGWASVDARRDGKTLRFITTHLEVASSPAAAVVQTRQARELIEGPARTSMPVVMVGDFNASPDTTTYAALLAAGFGDAWSRRPDASPGFTCCHAMAVADPADSLGSRIDLILTRGEVSATEVAVVGAEPGDFSGGLWPSDHAGVVASLEL